MQVVRNRHRSPKGEAYDGCLSHGIISESTLMGIQHAQYVTEWEP